MVLQVGYPLLSSLGSHNFTETDFKIATCNCCIHCKIVSQRSSCPFKVSHKTTHDLLKRLTQQTWTSAACSTLAKPDASKDDQSSLKLSVMSVLPFLPYIMNRPDKPALSLFIFRNLLYLELNLSFCCLLAANIDRQQ